MMERSARISHNEQTPSRWGFLLVGALALLGILGFLASCSSPAAPVKPAPDSTAAVPILAGDTVLSQTVAGYTVALQSPSEDRMRAADATAMFLEYRVTDPQGHTERSLTVRWAGPAGEDAPTLIAENNQGLPWLGTTQEIDPMPGGRFPWTEPLLVFDSSGLPPGTTDHILQLTLHLRIAAGPPRDRLATDPSPTPVATRAVAGPFTFRFRLPFTPLHAWAEVQQTNAAGGIPITLERVLLVPWEARVILRFAAPDGAAAQRWQPVDALIEGTGARRVTLLPLGRWLNEDPRVDGWRADGTWSGSALDFARWPGMLDGGPWTLTIGALAGPGTPATRVRGPWIFHFTMPPLTPRPTPPPTVPSAPTAPPPPMLPASPPEEPPTHEPMPTVPLPGPVVTAGPPAAPVLPPPIRTVYPTIDPRNRPLTATPIPAPLPASGAPLHLHNPHRLLLAPTLVSANIDVTNPAVWAATGDAILVATRDHRLLLVRLDGSPAVPLADDVATYAWAPGSRYIAYLHYEPMGQPAFITVPYAVSADGRVRHPLAFNGIYMGILPPLTAGDAWAVYNESLWRIPLDGGAHEEVISVPDLLLDRPFAVAPNEQRMAYACVGGTCLQNRDGSAWTKAALPAAGLLWNPDATRLAALVSEIGDWSRRAIITVVQADGTQVASRMLATSAGPPVLQWTPDGRYLFITRVGADQQVDLDLLDATSGQTWGGLAPAGISEATISPDGRQVLLRRGAAEFWVADLGP